MSVETTKKNGLPANKANERNSNNNKKEESSIRTNERNECLVNFCIHPYACICTTYIYRVDVPTTVSVHAKNNMGKKLNTNRTRSKKIKEKYERSLFQM